MNVLLLARSDWAGLGSLLAQSLCSVGVNAKIYTINKGPYNHPSVSISKSEMINFSKACDIIQFMHSEKVPISIELTGKKVVVFHGGGKYRNNPEKICGIFNPIVDCSIIQTYDLMGYGAKNETWLLPPINTNNLKPIYKTKSEKIIVGHYPSSPSGKGTEYVNEIINRIKNLVPEFEYRYSTERVSWKKQIERMSKVDIYIERMSMRKKEKSGEVRKTGVWGITALEAAALGKVVVTNFYGRKYYQEEYGDCALYTANSEKEMESLLIDLLSIPKSNLITLKENTRKWVEEKHSFIPIGNRLRNIYERL